MYIIKKENVKRGLQNMKEIFTRRSHRKFTDEPVSRKETEQLLRAAMAAPSAVNAQDWAFVVIDDKEIFRQIQQVHEYASPLNTAPLAILVCGDLSRQKAPGEWWVQDCSAATQNILLEAVSLGLGTVWMGVYPYEHRWQSIARILSLPNHLIPMALIAVGHSAETEKDPIDRYDAEQVWYNHYGQTL